AVQGADLVAGRVAQIGQVQLAEGPLAQTRRVLDGAPAGRHPGVVEGVDRLGRPGREADGAAVGVAGRLAVDRLADGEGAARRAPPVATLRVRPLRRLVTERGQDRVIEFARRLDVVCADGDVGEHDSPLLL